MSYTGSSPVWGSFRRLFRGKCILKGWWTKTRDVCAMQRYGSERSRRKKGVIARIAVERKDIAYCGSSNR